MVHLWPIENSAVEYGLLIFTTLQGVEFPLEATIRTTGS